MGISKHFLNDDLCAHLADNLMALHESMRMDTAGTGNNQEIARNDKVRGDSIYWLDRKHDDPYENEFFDVMDAFIIYLNQSCYTGITGYEFHYTLYEEGSFYKKHIDQFQNDNSRQFSMICYLNEGWLKSHGGQLLIQMEDEEQSITPTKGKTVFFKSNELEHEVLPTKKNRMSITGWLKK
ncbi:MAG: proline hydroxylase [Chitinophagaceae bacterium]|nr:proline hydroxylase [Chitinophagaceae bacterium]